MFDKLWEILLLLEFIFGFELFQNSEILRNSRNTRRLRFTGESVLNKLGTNFMNKKKRYYPFTNMVVHYLCINDVINEKTTRSATTKIVPFFGWHSVHFWRQSGIRGRFSLLPGCTLFLYTARELERACG